jgi:hypothetical protein
MYAFRAEQRVRAALLCVFFAVLHKVSKELAGEQSPSKAAFVFDVCPLVGQCEDISGHTSVTKTKVKCASWELNRGRLMKGAKPCPTTPSA